MFERFTDRARQTVVFAQEEARQMAHPYIGTEHILLGLLREREGIAAQSLARLGITLDVVRDDVVRIIGEGDVAPSGHIPFTPRSKKVLELSLREALEFGNNFIGTEHILLGLVREGEGVATQILVGRGANLKRVRATVLTMARHGTTGQTEGRPERTAGGEEALSNARQLAGGAAVGSHHLLEALARSEDGLAAKVLSSLGVDADTLAAKIDEIGLDGTSDVTPEETAGRQIEIRVEDDAAHIVLRDATTVRLVRSITETLDGPVRGDDAAVGSLAALWQSIADGLEEIRERVAPIDEESDTPAERSTIVRRAFQSRLARRRAR
ncbi:MAG TPA: Clp protease N-terminal domain-containing protein [Ilumatobacteraceae bacterium]|jgi:ATP-dependent Clp protease ATP-binding subunit ClpC